MKNFQDSTMKFECTFTIFCIMLRKKQKANEDAMKAIAEKRRQEKKNNMRHHYEHLCSTQIEKSYCEKYISYV